MRGVVPIVTALTIRSSGTSTQAAPARPPLSSNVRAYAGLLVVVLNKQGNCIVS
jgi:hypothetical protein